MIFNTSDDIKNNVKDLIIKYLRDTINQDTIIDTNNIISLLRTYLYELKIREEVLEYTVNDYQNDYIINIKIQRNIDCINFKIDLYSELRKMKIVKIQKHNNDKISKLFIIY